MKISTLANLSLATALLTLPAVLPAASLVGDGVVHYDWDLTCEVDDCPEEWAQYEKDLAKWIRKYGGNAGRETDWKKVRDMAAKSPGCVALPQQGTDHWRIYMTDVVEPHRGKVRGKHFASFSANSTGSQDKARKLASAAILGTCGYIGGTAGRAGLGG